MPSKKRARPTSGVSDGANPPKPFSLERYHLLPLELQHLIISFACLHPTPGTPSALTPFATDSATILALCLVNRELRELVQHRLYQEISVTRPSKLYALQQMLVERPEVGKSIERLHIGPQNILPAHWWPLTNAYAAGYSYESPGEEGCGGPFDWLATSLNKSQLPAGFEDRQPFALQSSTQASCRDIAITRAIETAEAEYWANLSQRTISSSARMEVTFEVQAALDLYLMEIQSREQENPHLRRLAARTSRVPPRCSDGECEHYPSLNLTVGIVCEGDRRFGAKGAYELSRSQLLRHLARPGSLTDRFDHPLYFSRSGFSISTTAPPGRGHKDYSAEATATGARYTIRSRFWDSELGHQVHDWPELAALKREDEQLVAALKPARNSALLKTATVAQNLRLARDVLALTPSLKSLSLTGFLESAVGGGDNQKLPTLQRLSLGPPPVCWNGGLLLQGVQSVEELRIAGTALVAGEVEVITSTKPNLRQLEWIMKETMPSNMQLNIAQTVEVLLESNQTSSGSAEARTGPVEEADDLVGEHVITSEAQSGSLPCPITESISSVQDDGKPPLRIVACLHPVDVALVLASAPSEEVKAAWLGGGDAAGSSASVPRLLLRESRVPASEGDGSLRPSQDSTSGVWQGFYEEGREWWVG